MDQEFYYLDRPSVPATEQVTINLKALVAHSIPKTTRDMGDWLADVSEVKNSDGDVVGVLAYFGGISYETLVAPGESDIENAVKDSAAHQDSESTTPSVDFDQIAYHYDGTGFAADQEVASLLDQVEAHQDGDYEGDVDDLIDSLANALVKLQVRNNNQRDMLMKRADSDDVEDTI